MTTSTDLTKNPANPKQRGNYNLTNFVSNYDDLHETSISDIISSVDNANYDFLERTQSNDILYRIGYYLNLSNPIEWVFLLTLVFMIGFDYIIITCHEARVYLGSTNSAYINIIFWIPSCVLLFLLATSVGYFISPDVDGSGFPEMKAVLSGITSGLDKYFSFNTFIAKIIGLFAFIVSGASIGRAGPFVHISGLICNQLMKLNCFSKINNSTTSKSNMLSAAISAGVTLALGTPLGAVLFSIEATSTIYVVSNIWKSFFCSVICSLISRVVLSKERYQLFYVGPTEPFALGPELILIVILGLLGGVIGALFSTFLAKGCYIRRKTTINILNNRFTYAIVIAVITSVTTYILIPFRCLDKEMLSFLFSVKPQNLRNGLDELVHPREGIILLYLFFFKFVLSILCLTVSAPCGLVSTCFVVGGLFGRVYGHFLGQIFSLSNEAIYAMIGGACVLSGATHTISSSLIIFELTGDTTLIAPLLLATLLSNITAQSLSMSVFDVMGAVKNLPYLQNLKCQNLYNLETSNIMKKVDFFLVKQNFTYIEIIRILHFIPKKYTTTIPILDEDKNIQYTVNGKSLYKYIINHFETVKDEYNQKMQDQFNEFFSLTRKKFYETQRSFIEQIKNKCNKLFKQIKSTAVKFDEKIFEEDTRNRLWTMFSEDMHDDKIFLKVLIDVEDSKLCAEKSAFTIDKSLSVLKVQFLFTFLNVSHIFVTNKGEMVGMITKEDFIKKASLLEK